MFGYYGLVLRYFEFLGDPFKSFCDFVEFDFSEICWELFQFLDFVTVLIDGYLKEHKTLCYI